MSRLKLVVQALYIPVLILCISAGVATTAHAVNVQAAIAGSSALWQNMALAAYNNGACVAGSGATAPCFHYTGKGFQLNDQRVPGGHLDTGNIWIVWDSAANTNVWMYVNVDSVVGDRCYFAQPQCQVKVPAPFPGAANIITLAGAIWGGAAADQLPPVAVQNLLTAGAFPLVSVAATDIRPEDAFYADCRANASFAGDANDDKALGYNPNNPWNGDAAGDIYCPPNVTTVAAAYPTLVGNSVLNPFSTSSAGVIAFNISGTDPFPPNTAIPAATVVPVGAAPILFITRRNHNPGLKNLLAATDGDLHCVYTVDNGGPQQSAACFGLAAAPIDVFQREPISGTMNTTEFSVFRNHPFQTFSSQESGMAALINPLSQVGAACSGPGNAGRFRVIGTGQMVSEVQTSTAPADNTCDALGYAFFSFGNVLPIAGNASYAYLTLDGIDPLAPGALMPAGPPAQELPNANALPAAAGCPGNTLPCDEAHLWGAPGAKLSFPGLRAAGTLAGPPYSPNVYRAWSVLRLVSNGAALANAKLLVSGAQLAAVCSVPDYVPAVAVTVTCPSGTKIVDPGLANYHSHYKLVYSTGGAAITVNPNNGFVGAESGRDEGGCLFAKPGPGLPGTLNLGQEYVNPNTGQCAAPVFP